MIRVNPELYDLIKAIHYKVDSLIIINEELRNNQEAFMATFTWLWEKGKYVLGFAFTMIAGLYGKDFLKVAAKLYLKRVNGNATKSR